MEQNLSDGINRPKPSRSDHNAIRQSFRVSVQPEGVFFVVLDGETYSVADISPEGINFFCRARSRFALDRVIENCELILPGDKIKGLTARVVHSSCGPEGKWTSGIQWVDLPDTALDIIVRQVSKIKNTLRQILISREKK